MRGLVLFILSVFFIGQVYSLRCDQLPGVFTKIQTQHYFGAFSGNDQVKVPSYKELVLQSITQLDGMKLLFTKDKVARFTSGINQVKTANDHFMSGGDCRVFFEIYDEYVRQVELAKKYFMTVKYGDLNFDQDDHYHLMPNNDYAVTNEELKLRQKKYFKLKMFLSMLDAYSQKEAFLHVKDGIKFEFINRDRMKNGNVDFIIDAYLALLDPHSVYMSEFEYQSFVSTSNHKLSGIGVELSWGLGYAKIRKVLNGGAAFLQGGLAIGDELWAITKPNGSRVSLVGLSLNEIISPVVGESGTSIDIEVLRKKDSDKEVVTVSLNRSPIPFIDQEISSKLLKVTKNGKLMTLMVLTVPEFYVGLYEDAIELLNRNIRNQKVDGIVVDLRGNTGGDLREALLFTDIFINGPLLQVRQNEGAFITKSYLYSGERNEDLAFEIESPIVVLTSSQSASASEIFAAAIKDYRKGVIVGGDKTWGKGSIQRIIQLDRSLGGALKLTAGRFYRVNGKSTQNIGVKSDIILPGLNSKVKSGEQYLSNSFDVDVIEQADFIQHADINEYAISFLREKSKKRVSQNKNLLLISTTSVMNNPLSNEMVSTVNMNFNQYRLDQESILAIDVGDADLWIDETLNVLADLVTYLESS